ncbi:hypothetical protein NP233_g10409 [Leucocoprinus birnbaumii]|uniref:Uncharacterized protein n=1 Tax=Leucocoprinus birnbaumii TaxID=56174 RepID=A0AAD5VPC2_9AGAR|nr:hypothetical protein NP233_g10409 [Leucocoprinus birnbaumii]
MAATLAAVFGPEIMKGVSNVIKDFDFSQCNVKDSTADDYLHVGIAPSFANINSESVKALDEKLKFMIAGTMRALEKKRTDVQRALTWDEVISVLMQNSLIEPDDGKIDRADKLIKPSKVNAFKFDGSPDAAIVKEVETWFQKFINDPDVLGSTKIDINVLGKIVAQTGATVDSFETLFYKNEHHEKTLVDIGILRFPDEAHPYFKVYRIKLTAWSASARYLFVQEDQSGITGEFNARNFRPRASVIDRLKKETIAQVAKEAEALFQ